MSPRKHDHGISLDQARQLVQNHSRNAPAGGEKCGYFARAAFDEILAQPGCAGIRFYHGRDAQGTPTLLFVGVTEEQVDMLDGLIVENHVPCPPNCGGTTLGGG